MLFTEHCPSNYSSNSVRQAVPHEHRSQHCSRHCSFATFSSFQHTSLLLRQRGFSYTFSFFRFLSLTKFCRLCRAEGALNLLHWNFEFRKHLASLFISWFGRCWFELKRLWIGSGIRLPLLKNKIWFSLYQHHTACRRLLLKGSFNLKLRFSTTFNNLIVWPIDWIQY